MFLAIFYICYLINFKTVHNNFFYICYLINFKIVHNNFYKSNIRYYMYNYIHFCVDEVSISIFALDPEDLPMSSEL
jgi:hypothetical protein